MAAQRSVGISGMAVALATAGLFFVYAGIKDIDTVDGLRAFARGEIPVGAAHARTTSSDTTTNAVNALAKAVGTAASAQIGLTNGVVDGLGNTLHGVSNAITGSAPTMMAIAAASLVGTPYKLGGVDKTGVDCSGTVMYGMKAAGINYTGAHSAYTITRSNIFKYMGVYPTFKADTGDVAWWPGHCAVVVIQNGKTNVVNAAMPGTKVRIQPIWGNPQIYRLKVATVLTGAAGGGS